MNDNSAPPRPKKLSVSGKTLTLKPRSETGVVRQSFKHGRSKQVVIEKVKRRVVGSTDDSRRRTELSWLSQIEAYYSQLGNESQRFWSSQEEEEARDRADQEVEAAPSK